MIDISLTEISHNVLIEFPYNKCSAVLSSPYFSFDLDFSSNSNTNKLMFCINIMVLSQFLVIFFFKKRDKVSTMSFHPYSIRLLCGECDWFWGFIKIQLDQNESFSSNVKVQRSVYQSSGLDMGPVSSVLKFKSYLFILLSSTLVSLSHIGVRFSLLDVFNYFYYYAIHCSVT